MQRNGFSYAVETHHGNHPKQYISETEREVGFYRHDQWGFACLADDTRVLTMVFFFGGDHGLGGTVTGTNINKGGQHCNRMHKHMFKLSHDVNGIDVT